MQEFGFKLYLLAPQIEQIIDFSLYFPLWVFVKGAAHLRTYNSILIQILLVGSILEHTLMIRIVHIVDRGELKSSMQKKFHRTSINSGTHHILFYKMNVCYCYKLNPFIL